MTATITAVIVRIFIRVYQLTIANLASIVLTDMFRIVYNNKQYRI